MNRKKIFALLVLVIIGTICIFTFLYKKNSFKVCNHCNVLLVDIDTLRADELPCYGYSRNTTPNICNFAKKSLVFKNNFSSSDWTLPSIFSTITSLYPTFHRVRTPYLDILSNNKTTLAQTLKNQGYQTAFVGFDNNTSTLTRENNGLSSYDLITSKPVTEVINKLSKSNKPWFIHYYRDDLHLPYLLPNNAHPIDSLENPRNIPITRDEFNIVFNKYLKKNYSEVFSQSVIEENSSIFSKNNQEKDLAFSDLFYKLYNYYPNREKKLINIYKPIYNAYISTFDKNNPSHQTFLRMMYDSTVYQVDKTLLPLFELLESQKIKKNTITILMSDHGESFGEYGKLGHDSNNHSVLHYTPLIVNSPKISAKVVKSTTGNIDIFPSIMEMLGLDKVPFLQGESLFSKRSDKNNRLIYSESTEGLILLNDEWFYFLPKNATHINQSILYNKKLDPQEKNNCINQYPDFTQMLYQKLRTLQSYDRFFMRLPTPSISNIDSDKIDRLKKEGYF